MSVKTQKALHFCMHISG